MPTRRLINGLVHHARPVNEQGKGCSTQPGPSKEQGRYSIGGMDCAAAKHDTVESFAI
jgi:hypothetical protein